MNVPVQFVFTPDSNPETETIMICEAYNRKEKQYYYDNWIVERQQSKPHSCLLHIGSVSMNESGSYSCVGILPHGVADWSERNLSVIVASKLTASRSIVPNQTMFNDILTAIFGIFVSLSMIVVAVFCSAILIGYAHRRRRRRNGEFPTSSIMLCIVK